MARAYWKSATFADEDGDDLRWYWCEAEGVLGQRSGLGPMLDRARDGTLSKAPQSAPDQPLTPPGATARFARIARALDGLRDGQNGLLHQRVLLAVYGPPPKPGSVDALASAMTKPAELGLVFRHIASLRESAADGAGTLSRALERAVKAGHLAALTSQAREMIRDARAAYATVRRELE